MSEAAGGRPACDETVHVMAARLTMRSDALPLDQTVAPRCPLRARCRAIGRRVHKRASLRSASRPGSRVKGAITAIPSSVHADKAGRPKAEHDWYPIVAVRRRSSDDVHRAHVRDVDCPESCTAQKAKACRR